MHNIIGLVNHRKKNSRANHLNPPMIHMNRVGMLLLFNDIGLVG